MTRALYLRMLLSTAVGLLPAVAAAQANDSAANAGPKIEEVIVTAQKRSENLQNVPIAVSVVQAEQLAAAGVGKMTEISMVTPGLTINTSGGAYVLPRIRGVGQSGATMGLENPVAVYVDNVYYSSPSGSLFALNNIAQIAVLKGPQGTLFGRNATGGLIQVTTLDPSSEASGKFSATVANKDTFGTSAYFTTGLFPNVAADVAFYYNDQGDGFGKNVVTGQDVNDIRDLAVRSKIKAELGDTTITLAGDYSLARTHYPAWQTVGRPLFGTTFVGGKFDVANDTQAFTRTEQAGGSLTIEHDFGPFRLTSISAHRWTVGSARFDNDAMPAPTVFDPDTQSVITATEHERSFTQEFQVSSDTDGPLTWTAGLFYFQYKGTYGPYININQLDLFQDIRIAGNLDSKSYAGYAQATYAVTDRLNLTAGLRYTKEKRLVDGVQDVRIGGVQVAIFPSDGRVTKSQVTWRFAADYRFSDEALAYISYNRGFRSGGFSPAELPYASFKPELIDAYEVGAKLDLFDRRLRINPSVFYYDYSNLQATIYANGFIVTQNAASAKIYGMDLDLQGAVTENFTVTAGLSILHARYDLFRGAQISQPDPVNGGNIITSADVRDTRVSNTPDWTLSLGAEYRVPVGENELTLHANYYYNDGFFNDAENRQHQDSYHLFNASAELKTENGYTLSVWGKNLGNVAYAYQLYTSRAGDKIRFAPGRTFGVTAGVEF